MLYTGDTFPGKFIPALDRANGSHGVEYPDTLAKAISVIRDVDTVVTGHRGVMQPADFAEFAATRALGAKSPTSFQLARIQASQFGGVWERSVF